MNSPKFIAFAGVFGFVLSFLVGIFSGNPFGIVLLRAFICALGFVVVSFGALLLYNYFLNIKVNEPFERETVNASSVELPEDDFLPEDNGPSFFVDDIQERRPTVQRKTSATERQSFDFDELTDFKSEQNISSENDSEDVDFENMNSMEKDFIDVDSIDVDENVQNSVLKNVNEDIKQKVAVQDDDEVLDELPEISNYVAMDTTESSSESIYSSPSSSFTPASLDEMTNFQDSTVIAQAIRTALAND
ncbi:MAG: hypothetical protein GX220_03765 [Treponema sp.]|nr:hypothetical protein [Treponema sp.]